MKGIDAKSCKRARARDLRREQTGAEKKLWHLLQNRGLGGLKFRRQAPIGKYYGDFLLC